MNYFVGQARARSILKFEIFHEILPFFRRVLDSVKGSFCGSRAIDPFLENYQYDLWQAY